ncbi:flagellar assembly protein FliH [Oxalobacteraceae bacterium A2-2]
MSNLPKQQPAYQRWEMTSFGDNRPSAVAQREAEERAREAQRAQELLEQRMQEALAAQQEQMEMGPAAPLPPEYPTVEELEAIREEARQSGHAEGHAEGLEAGRAEAQEAGRKALVAELEPMRALVQSFSAALQDADQAIAADVLELALQLAKGMLKQALQVKPDLIVPIVRDAISYLPVVQAPAVLMLHPDDAPIVREAMADELDKGGWQLAEDATVGRGGCKVDTASNQIDATAAARWQRLTHALGKDVDWLA